MQISYWYYWYLLSWDEAQSIAWQNIVQRIHVCDLHHCLEWCYPIGLEHTRTLFHDIYRKREREREREMTSTQTYQWQFQKFQILQVPGHFFHARVRPQLTCTAAIPSPGRWAWKIACKIRYVWYANVCSCWNICADRYQCYTADTWLYCSIFVFGC